MENLTNYLNRIGNIKRVSDKLAAESAEFATFIIDAMTSAGVSKLLGGDLILSVNHYKPNAGGACDKLFFDTGDCNSEYGNAGDLTSSTIDANDGKYLYGDFNCWMQYPNRDEVLLLLSKKEEILKELAKFGE